MKKFGRKTTLNLRYGSDMGSHSVVSDWKGYDFMEIVEKKETNADRIRNMSDEELAETIHSISCNATEISTCKEECLKCEQPDSYCVRNIMEWLQSEAE